MKSRFAIARVGMIVAIILAVFPVLPVIDEPTAVAAKAIADRDILDIYFIDVEGGAATLIVTRRRSIIVDSGSGRERASASPK